MHDAQPFISITVHTGAAPRREWPVDVTLDSSLIQAVAPAGVGLSQAQMRLVEGGGAGSASSRPAPFQLDTVDDGAAYDGAPDAGDNVHDPVARLTFLLSGDTPASTTREFRLYLTNGGEASAPPPPLVTVTDNVLHEEQESYRIDTPAAAYLYHKLGGGFASMIDVDGADWLSYHPWGGSDGKFRGIPNLAYPESNFHPGNTESTSRIIARGPLRATIRSQTNDGEWACQWDIYPSFARLTVLRAGHPYWFLYEGTPGGKLDEAGDWLVRAPGIRASAAERWDERLPAPRWIYFGAAGTNRALYLVHHEDDGETDSYWPMEQNMTVFGFGRRGLAGSLTRAPARFTAGFAEGVASPDDDVPDAIRSACEPPTIEVGVSG